MSDKNFQLSDGPKLDLEQARAAATSLSSDAWSEPLNRAGFGQHGKDIAITAASGAAAGTLVGIGIGAANDSISRVMSEVTRVPMQILFSSMSGKAVLLEPLVLESSIPRIASRGGLIGAATALAAYGAYELYENYKHKDK